jgi:hypothetical protein
MYLFIILLSSCLPLHFLNNTSLFLLSFPNSCFYSSLASYSSFLFKNSISFLKPQITMKSYLSLLYRYFPICLFFHQLLSHQQPLLLKQDFKQLPYLFLQNSLFTFSLENISLSLILETHHLILFIFVFCHDF